MKEWKTWAIILLAGVAIFQYRELRNIKQSSETEIRLRNWQIDQLNADILSLKNNMIDSTTLHIAQLNCGLYETSFKQWDTCVHKRLREREEK